MTFGQLTGQQDLKFCSVSDQHIALNISEEKKKQITIF